jgi:hypothetical protein
MTDACERILEVIQRTRPIPRDTLAGYAGAVNPTYITLSRRAHRDRFVSEVPAKSHGSIFSRLKIA